ncbi:MAG: DUF2845 domain-containing protein [Pseudomonas sp.]|nr:DUF2845 domain-containing protein [Pseudomonas sp.]
MKAFLTLILSAAIGLASTSAMASTFRCGSKLVSLGDRAFTVLRTCGEPTSRDSIGYTGAYHNRNAIPIEEWVYGPKGGMYYYLRFEGGELVKITSSR